MAGVSGGLSAGRRAAGGRGAPRKPGPRRHARPSRRRGAARQRQSRRRPRRRARCVLPRGAGGRHRALRAGARRRARQGRRRGVRGPGGECGRSGLRRAHGLEVPGVDQRAAPAPGAGLARSGRAPGGRPQLGRLPPPGDRGPQARLRRPRAVLRRSPARGRAARRPPVRGLRGGAPAPDRSRAGFARPPPGRPAPAPPAARGPPVRSRSPRARHGARERGGWPAQHGERDRQRRVAQRLPGGAGARLPTLVSVPDVLAGARACERRRAREAAPDHPDADARDRAAAVRGW